MKVMVRKTNDIGYTYIEIDLTAQRMVFYKDGTPTADAQIVSGIHSCPTVQLLWDVIQQVK